MSDKNKACPFCGSTKLKTVVDDGIHFVQCRKCESTGPTGFKRGDEDDMDWNTRAQPSDGALTNEGAEPVDFEHRKDLACWFGLSYATFLVLPRVLMQEMPSEWQERLAVLLNEYDDTFPSQPDIGTTVQATKNGKLTKMPPWLLNYQHPAREEIAKLKAPSA